ncbi:homocitrate synthase lys21 [Diaporthe australafricana]|uniref:Homocitrate synthase lys21 n=1 Tax=Diaporthe australafricana TaxID=127596 RepID=A0ABR3XQD7_9PEZI
MCPTPDAAPATTSRTNGANGANGTDKSHPGFTAIPTKSTRSAPYQPVGDFLSNVSRFKIIESTLREGEQFANAFFDIDTKIKIAKALDEFGVDYIELTSPAASEASRKDCETICKLGLKAKILTHVRCHMDDARLAVETGVDGLDVVIGTSSYLREHSHGKDMTYIINTAIEVIEFVKSKGLEVRFSSEDSFRSDLVDLLSVYSAVDKVGVTRVGIADTVGCASPRQVYDLVRTLRGVVKCDIETHFHDDTGCAIANAYCALEAGATHVDTSVLGIGERNGITTLGGLMARMIVADREYVTSKYNLAKLKDLENLVADAVQINVPFNNPITGFCAFTHKAGIHAKAILNNPETYEILKPEDFGLSRYVHFASRLTGWNAIKSRIEQLGLSMTDDQVKLCTQKVKAMADVRPLAIDDADSVIRTFHLNLTADEQKPLLPDLTSEEHAKFKKAERELAGQPEKRASDEVTTEETNGSSAKKVKDSPLSNYEAVSGCESGGNAFTCTNQAPWAANSLVSYGFAATSISGGTESSWCCACYALTFTSGKAKGKVMLVQSVNTGGDLSGNQFDLQIPGGGTGIFDGCTSEFGSSWGAQYGGVSNETQCSTLPTKLQAGCDWRFDWFRNSDNPTHTFTQISCPAELTGVTGCVRDDDASFPKFVMPSPATWTAPTPTATAAAYAQCDSLTWDVPMLCPSGYYCSYVTDLRSRNGAAFLVIDCIDPEE